MGNACTIHNTTKPSPSPSLVFPPIPEFLQEIYSQYKIDCFSQANSQSATSSAIMALPTIKTTKSYKRPLYTVNKRNLGKAIQEQASPGPSPSKRMASKSASQFLKLSGNGNPLSKEKWSKESSFIRQNPPSFHTSVSEIYDDGYMEYSRDSESLKVEDLWQDVSRTANSELQKGLSERLAQHNLEDRRRSDSYLTAVQEVFAGKIINVEDYRRGSVEGNLQNNPSPQKRNLKKEEVKMFQFRVEKEESNVKIPTFGKAESPERVKENLEKQPDNTNILNNDAPGIEVQQKISSQKEKEIRMAKSLTTVAQSFSPIRRSQNASPEAKSDENPFREEKSLYNESISPFEISPMKIDNSNSASKLPQSGFKPLVKYCSVGTLEPAQTAGLYDGIQGVSKSNPSSFKCTPVVSDVEKMYASVQLYPTENHMDNTDKTKRDFGPRKGSLMDRLMESLLEDRIRREEPKAILEAIEKESPSPSVKGNAFEKEKSSYEPSKFEYNSRQRLDYTADQSEISRSIAYKQPTPAQDTSNNVRFLEKTKNVTSNILKDMDKEINPFKRQENQVEQGNKDSRETHNSLVSSAHVSRGASPHLKSEMLDVSREQILSQMEEARKMMQAKEKRMLLENSFQKERGEIVTDQKAIVEEIKNLQKEVFDRMSVVTSNMKGKMLTPKKMLELKDIQDKIQILTQLGTMIEAGEAAAAATAKQSQESVSQAASTRRSISNIKERSILPKADSLQKSNRSFNKDAARNYFSCSKPSTTTSQGTSQNIKRNSSMTNINANVSTKNTYASKPASHQSTEPDNSIVLKPPSAPSDCKSTQEFLETEIECIQNPKEVWKRPISETSNQKPSKNLSYSSEPKSSHKHLMPFPAKELEPYQSVEPRPRRVTEVLSSSKSYLGHDVSITNYSSVATSSKDLLSQLYTEKKESSSTSTTTTGIHNVIKKLAQPKNLSTYATPQVQQQKPAYRYATVDPTSIPGNPKSVSVNKQQDSAVRRQSTGSERPENKKPNTYKDMTLKSRVSSVEKIKPAPVQDKYASLAKNESQSQLKHIPSNKRLSVGNSSVVVKEYSMSSQDQRDKSPGPGPKKPVEIEKKQKMDKDKVIIAPENNENVPEESLNTIMNDSKFENDQAEMLYEEITKLDQKLAVTKSTGKIPLVEESMEKSPIKKTRASEHSAERGNKKGSYIQQAVKKSERHFTPLMGRVNRQNHNQSTEICERRQTISNLSVQQEQVDSHITTEALGEDAKKGGKYNYNQALQMRIKFAEEVARRQSVADSTEWILNAKLPLYAGKIQDKAKKNQG